MPFNFIGQEIFKRAVKGMNTAVERVFEETGLTTDDIDSLIPHQANKRLIDYLAKMCKVPEEKTVINIQKYGNTSSATLPDRKSTRLNSSHVRISYAVFC